MTTPRTTGDPRDLRIEPCAFCLDVAGGPRRCVRVGMDPNRALPPVPGLVPLIVAPICAACVHGLALRFGYSLLNQVTWKPLDLYPEDERPPVVWPPPAEGGTEVES